jgi:hypothetical protein
LLTTLEPSASLTLLLLLQCTNKRTHKHSTHTHTHAHKHTHTHTHTHQLKDANTYGSQDMHGVPRTRPRKCVGQGGRPGAPGGARPGGLLWTVFINRRFEGPLPSVSLPSHPPPCPSVGASGGSVCPFILSPPRDRSTSRISCGRPATTTVDPVVAE